jgi:hypothetical protein
VHVSFSVNDLVRNAERCVGLLWSGIIGEVDFPARIVEWNLFEHKCQYFDDGAA